MAAFDCTYLTRTLAQLCLNNESGMVGGVWGPPDVDQSFLCLDKGDVDISKVVKAPTMLEMVAWDPAGVRKIPLSICSIPIESNFSGPGSTVRGCWFMMELLGSIMAEGSTFIKALIFDAHGSHSVIRRVLHGQLSGVSDYDLSKMESWKDLTFQPVPQSCLPRFPAQLCLHRDEFIYGIPGVCPSDAQRP